MFKSVGEEQAGDGDACGAGAIYNNLAVLLFLSRNSQSVNDARKNNNSCAVLVIVKYGNVQKLF